MLYSIIFSFPSHCVRMSITAVSGVFLCCIHTKLLSLIFDNTLSWKPHVDHLLNELSTACYVIRYVKPHVNINAIIMIYHSHFHAVMTYGIIFLGNSSHSIQVFRIQKKAIRIIMGCGNRESCRKL